MVRNFPDAPWLAVRPADGYVGEMIAWALDLE
jgi:hypothetical protein